MGKDLKQYTNPITTKEHINELHHILVQTCLNYMKKNNLSDIDEIHFSADGLSGESYKRCEWTPQTDSSIDVIGIEKEKWVGKSGKEYVTPIRARIGSQM